MEKKSFCVIFTVVISLVLVSAGISQAVPTNGVFDGGLNPWVVENGIVTDDEGGGDALFLEDAVNLNSTLSQQFKLPGNAMTLFFDVHMRSTPEEPGSPPYTFGEGQHCFLNELDVFTAYLLDPDSGETLVPAVGPDPKAFFYLDNSAEDEFIATIELDVSDLAGRDEDVLLRFNLFSYDNKKAMFVRIDNVNVFEAVSVVPAPGALFLALTGAGIAGWLRRTKILR